MNKTIITLSICLSILNAKPTDNFLQLMKEEVQNAKKDIVYDKSKTINLTDISLNKNILVNSFDVEFSQFITNNSISKSMISHPENLKGSDFKLYYEKASAIALIGSIRKDICTDASTRNLMRQEIDIEYRYRWHGSPKYFFDHVYTEKECVDKIDKRGLK